ncbi:hypothetical protein [Streptomyces nymphaeiformis]|uniref:Uncharacterized protein n=1 Tax=Streptomyces nymphaeiformis TaxID=2663842 RepID=A0A7W7U4W5_9ACTN|nr:hypothetical protein [Streptomyces nymphaeiformis]MBB4985004.1 hypothetical protein [Streptomyces nymphaeiformis]
MQITSYKLDARHQPGFARVEAVADNCSGIVIRELNEGTGHVEIRVTNRRHFAEAVIVAEQQAIGVTHKPLLSDGYDAWGFTTVSSRGSVLLIDVESCRTTREIDRTLIHELVHAAQFRRPGVRDLVIAGLHNNYGVHQLSRAEAKRLNRQIAGREREAARLERFARQLRNFH